MSVFSIETFYKGFRFRSRLEARWAVFLDSIGVQWEYEKEGFELPSGRYLPDFWIPCPAFDRGYPEEPGYWFEIKGEKPNAKELQKCRELAEITGHIVLLSCGSLMLEQLTRYGFMPRHKSGKVIRVDETCSDDKDPSFEFLLNACRLEDFTKQPFFRHRMFAEQFCAGQRVDLTPQDLERAIINVRSSRFEFLEVTP